MQTILAKYHCLLSAPCFVLQCMFLSLLGCSHLYTSICMFSQLFPPYCNTCKNLQCRPEIIFQRHANFMLQTYLDTSTTLRARINSQTQKKEKQKLRRRKQKTGEEAWEGRGTKTFTLFLQHQARNVFHSKWIHITSGCRYIQKTKQNNKPVIESQSFNLNFTQKKKYICIDFSAVEVMYPSVDTQFMGMNISVKIFKNFLYR